MTILKEDFIGVQLMTLVFEIDMGISRPIQDSLYELTSIYQKVSEKSGILA